MSNFTLNVGHPNVKWSDYYRSPKQARCQSCQMSFGFYLAPPPDDRPRTIDCIDCIDCQGTNLDAMPWTELFITAPHRRRR